MKLTLIGWPLGHSLSPVFQNLALRKNGLSGSYELLPVEPEKDLRAVLSNLRADPDWAGGNVTVPYKEKVIPFLDGLEGAAEKLRAVNTIARRGDRLIGCNTDMPGFLSDLKRNAMLPAGGTALVLGSGGAARSVVFGLVQCGCEVAVIAAIREQAETLARELGAGRVRVLGWEDAGLREIARHTSVVVNTTPVGMWPHIEESVWPDDLPWPTGAVVYDLVYNPLETRFLRDAQVAGLRTASGLGMLVEQGALSFEMWTGREAPRAEMLQAAREALAEGG
jgi:shikimate dehydrogenase